MGPVEVEIKDWQGKGKKKVTTTLAEEVVLAEEEVKTNSHPKKKVHVCKILDTPSFSK